MADDEQPHEELSDSDFRKELSAIVPQLRAFARSLVNGQLEFADDLVQDALLRAWTARASFRAGTNFRAWIFVILRNIFLSEMRRSRFKGEWNELAAEKLLVAPEHQETHVELADVQRALGRLPLSQREALILVGAGGFSYKDAADITGVAVGTVKSRVARARTALEQALDGSDPLGDAKESEGKQPLKEIMAELDELSGGLDPSEDQVVNVK